MGVTEVLVVAAAYVIGSIDFGVIVPRLLGVDIYQIGSGNPGASNVLRSMGRGAAAAVLVGDLLKGVAAAALGDLVGTEALGFAAGFAAIVGHCFPVWYRFKGGKGVAAGGGALLWLEPILGIVLISTWAIGAFVLKRASIASLAIAVLYLPGLLLFGHREWSLVWAAVTAVLIVVRHGGNIRRLVSGTEHEIEEKES